MLPVVGLRKSRGGGQGTIRRSTFTENFASRTGGAFSLAARAKLDIDAATSVECNMASSGGAFAASPDASAPTSSERRLGRSEVASSSTRKEELRRNFHAGQRLRR